VVEAAALLSHRLRSMFDKGDTQSRIVLDFVEQFEQAIADVREARGEAE